MIERAAAERPQRVLQPFGERHIALATQDHMGMLEPRPDETEVIKPMVEGDAANGDTKIGHIGEVRQSHPAWFMGLAEDHLLLLAVKRPPAADPPLQRPADPGAKIGMAAQHLLEHRDRAQTRCRAQQRHDLGVEDIGQGVGSTSSPDTRLLRWQLRIVRDPVSGRRAEPGLGRRCRDAVTVSELHIEPHLMIVDVATRHPRLPLRERKPGIPDRP